MKYFTSLQILVTFRLSNIFSDSCSRSIICSLDQSLIFFFFGCFHFRYIHQLVYPFCFSFEYILHVYLLVYILDTLLSFDWFIISFFFFLIFKKNLIFDICWLSTFVCFHLGMLSVHYIIHFDTFSSSSMYLFLLFVFILGAYCFH